MVAVGLGVVEIVLDLQHVLHIRFDFGADFGEHGGAKLTSLAILVDRQLLSRFLQYNFQEQAVGELGQPRRPSRCHFAVGLGRGHAAKVNLHVQNTCTDGGLVPHEFHDLIAQGAEQREVGFVLRR